MTGRYVQIVVIYLFAVVVYMYRLIRTTREIKSDLPSNSTTNLYLLSVQTTMYVWMYGCQYFTISYLL